MDPLTRGDYPLSMRTLVGNRLPQFTKEQSELVKGAFDFIGLNYYTTNYADNLPLPNGHNVTYNTDARANLTGKYQKSSEESSICEMCIQEVELLFNKTLAFHF